MFTFVRIRRNRRIEDKDLWSAARRITPPFIGLHRIDPLKVDLNIQSKRESSFQAGKLPYSLGVLLYDIRKIIDKK